ncbi:MAG: hypothetical protein JO214_18860 [Frankiaceae bacterium]|nr:hypothetical protein [Frankiaceae bacterium]
MIEMTGEPLESHGDADLVAIRGGPSISDFLFAPAAMGLAAIVLGLADLLTIHLATEIASVHQIAFQRASILRGYQIQSAIQLGVGLIALGLAIGAVLRIRRVVWVNLVDDDDALLADVDEQTAVEPWIRASIGAGLLVSIVAVGLSTAAFVYALTAQLPKVGGPFN